VKNPPILILIVLVILAKNLIENPPKLLRRLILKENSKHLGSLINLRDVYSKL
jgi:hypothetical protein